MDEIGKALLNFYLVTFDVNVDAVRFEIVVDAGLFAGAD
jgi:hypothetical protein